MSHRTEGLLMNAVKNSTESLTLLSQILLKNLGATPAGSSANQEGVKRAYSAMSRPLSENLPEFHSLAHSHHVVMRAFPTLQQIAEDENDSRAADWAAQKLEQERARIRHALACLEPICDSLAQAGEVIVIKSLDHWPDLGNDLDLFTSAEPSDVVSIMKQRFEAKVAE